MIVINAERLVAAVIESGMGEVELCVKAGVGHQTFAKMMRGRMVRFSSVGRVCKVLDVSPAEIIREVPDETVPTQRQQELVPETGKQASQSEDHPQAVRLAVVGRTPG